MEQAHVVIVGCGFAGMSCARKLAANPGVRISLLDKNNYHQFTPLLYQVATAAVSSEEVATALTYYFQGMNNVNIQRERVVSISPQECSVKTEGGRSYQGDYLVIATGSTVNFFGTPGASQHSYPLYNLHDAERLRDHLLEIFAKANRDPGAVEPGLLNFAVVGGGPTGVELCGAVIDFLKAIVGEYPQSILQEVKIFLIDHNSYLLGAFSAKSQEYAKKILGERGVHFKLGLLVEEVEKDYLKLSDGTQLPTQTVIWAGGLQPALQAAALLPTGQGGRVITLPDLTVKGFSKIFALGDLALTRGTNGHPLPQLASVAQQCGSWAADNILADLQGKERQPFKYHDKGIMAMIGKDAAIAEVGEKRHQLEGTIAFAAWLGVHAALLPTFQQKVEAFIEWAWDYFGNKRQFQLIEDTSEEK